MYAEGETELRDLIVHNLETSGFLNKIKAELRAGVFLAFEEEGGIRTKIPLFNKKFDDFIETNDGKLVVSIVREFLDYFNLKFSLSVFDPEIASSSPCFNRSELFSKLSLKSSEYDGPVISAIMKSKLVPEPEKRVSKLSSENSPMSSISVTSSHKSLETISEDFPTRDRNGLENIKSNDNLSLTSFPSLNFDSSGKDKQMKENETVKQKSFVSDTFRKTNSTLIEKLKNESLELHDKEKPKISDVLNEKSHSLYKEKESTSLNDDPFFDEPLPSEKPSLFGLPSESAFSFNSLKEDTSNKTNDNGLFGTERNTLSSLKNLPALTTKSKDWNYSATELPKTLTSLSENSLSVLDKTDEKEIKGEDVVKKDPDPESNEESSDRQMNSDESIEEDLEGDYSAGIDDLLNSSLSLGDDATSDNTVSQMSVVDGVDHVEPVMN